MAEIERLLSAHSHRPWPIPQKKWQYYQEWNDVIFLHWEVPYSVLVSCVPETLSLENFDGKYYVSLVAFSMQEVRPRGIPSLSMVSDFHEINVRTYVSYKGIKGVYFLSVEAEKYLSVIIAKSLSGLPYEKARIVRNKGEYHSKNTKKGFELDISFALGTKQTTRSLLDTWLTEWYCLYLRHGSALYRYDIHHEEWKLRHIELKQLHSLYRIGHLEIEKKAADLVHYSDGVKVVAWKRQKIR